MDRLTPIESADPERRAGWQPLLPRPNRRGPRPVLLVAGVALVSLTLSLDELYVRRPAEEVRRDLIGRHERTAAWRRQVAANLNSNAPEVVRLRRDYLTSAAWHDSRARALREATGFDPVRERRAERANDATEARLDALEHQHDQSY